jgi:small ligand-binding sensory domain FIST
VRIQTQSDSNTALNGRGIRLKVATGLAIGSKALPELAAIAVQSAMQKASIKMPACVLLLLTSEFAASPLAAIKAAAKAANCTHVIGCTATGIFTDEDWVMDSPAAAAIVFSENVFVHVNHQQNTQKDNLNYHLTLTAPNAIDTRWLQNKELRFGGVSGDALGRGAFSVWQNAKATTQGYIEFSTDQLNCAVAATHGLKLISQPRRVTACQQNDVISLANLAAFEHLQKTWQKQSQSQGDLPYHQLMAVYANKAIDITRGHYLVASLVTGNPLDHSVTLSTNINSGQWLSWAIRDAHAAQIGIVKTASDLSLQLKEEPQFALLFSSLNRGPYLYNGLDLDLGLLKTIYPKLPIIGFYGNGQIAPINQQNQLLQYSAVLGLFNHTKVDA